MDSVCYLCQKPKGTLTCGICMRSVCKKCSQKLETGYFSFRSSVPEELTHPLYCGPCFDEKVAPEQAKYDYAMERARGIYWYEKKQSEETRFYHRSEKPIKVTDCDDREETLLRLAFLAAERDFNAIIDVELKATKVRNEGYQTSRWSGTAIPTNVDAEKLERAEKWRPSTYNF